MTDQIVFHARLEICRKCEFWRGACLKGHALQSEFGCPVRSFSGAAGYLPDVQLNLPVMPAVTGGCCGSPDEIKPMTWPQVWQHLFGALADWKKSGFALASNYVYAERIKTCKACPQYKFFQCRNCKCMVYTKAKLASENCPLGCWPVA